MYRIYLLIILFSVLIHTGNAQDTLVLINGKTLIVKSVELKDYTIAYRTLNSQKSRLRTMDPERVYSIKYHDGTEKVIYVRDTLDPVDFTAEQMRWFITGEQDADRYFKNHLNTGIAFAFGFGSALGAFYGLLGPPLYSTVVGSFSPNMKKQKVSDPAYLQISEYKEGYERKARDRKIRNSLLGGLAGFAAGIVTFTLIY
ncbi:MAG: hypothetical protein IT242_04885 [Bacteroidia bacterium]|nr:hypothetical protein [Bacteroidia bacterium]